MIEVSPDELKHAAESQHGGTATPAQSVPVHETTKRRTENEGMTFLHDETVWGGVVHVFDLEGHPNATRAWMKAGTPAYLVNIGMSGSVPETLMTHS